MNALLLSMPGTPIVYYGDEIGMGDNIYLGDRNGVRTPMQWGPGLNAGFSESNPQRLYLPLIIDPEFHHIVVQVENQASNPSSFLNWMRRILALRKQHPALGRGTFEFMRTDNSHVLAYERHYNDPCGARPTRSVRVLRLKCSGAWTVWRSSICITR